VVVTGGVVVVGVVGVDAPPPPHPETMKAQRTTAARAWGAFIIKRFLFQRGPNDGYESPDESEPDDPVPECGAMRVRVSSPNQVSRETVAGQPKLESAFASIYAKAGPSCRSESPQGMRPI
jgi:hypothetical protein